MTMSTPSQEDNIRRFSTDTVRSQIASYLRAWGMPEEQVETTATVMVDADLCGIDTHGISMIPTYDRRRRQGALRIPSTISVERESPVSALVDGGGGLGHYPAVCSVKLATEKARTSGLAVVAVRNSNHYGAAGYYARMLSASGLIGMSTTSGPQAWSAPTLGKGAKLSTNPLAFAAPGRRNDDFCLDMATTTVAAGKIRNRAVEDRTIPVGWANDGEGRPLLDPRAFDPDERGATMTPLGGTFEGASYKGYGLSVMVEILSTALTGARSVSSRNASTDVSSGMDVGHFFLAIDPLLFRDDGEFEDSIDSLIDGLHETTPIDPSRPVMVAGEPENKVRQERSRVGIPIPPGLLRQLAAVAESSNADFLLGTS